MLSLKHLATIDPLTRTGIVKKIMSTWIETDGPNVPIGTLCRINHDLLAEVVRVDLDSVCLLPFSDTSTITIGDRVEALKADARIGVGEVFAGRAIDALGMPIDDLGRLIPTTFSPLHGDILKPMERATPNIPLAVGIRAIDGLLPLGTGQRVGVFAASGVGKTTLLGQMVKQADVDKCVICLIGERGREVEAFWNMELPAHMRARATLVAATSDQSAALRVRAVNQALALAEYWRDEGRSVLLVVDSVTRYAMALREMGLAAGEPPTIRAYPPSTFSALPRLVERCGATKHKGSISAIMTVLAETDDIDDPISELMKSLLDGHIVLSRRLADAGHFPAVDVIRSVSRNAHLIMDAQHLTAASRIRALIALYDESRTLIESGLFLPGSNPDIDRAIEAKTRIDSYLRQAPDLSVERATAVTALQTLARTYQDGIASAHN